MVCAFFFPTPLADPRCSECLHVHAMGVLCFQSAVLDLRLGPGHVVRVQLDARDSVEVCVTPITPNASAPLAPPGNTRTHTLSAEPRGTAHPHKYDHVYVAYWCPAPIVSVLLPIWHCPIADPPPPLHVPAAAPHPLTPASPSPSPSPSPVCRMFYGVCPLGPWLHSPMHA